MIHDLKIQSQYFKNVVNGTKKFEIRKNDRGFKVGDEVRLYEIDEQSEYTGGVIAKKITFITDYEQKNGFVVFSLEDVKEDLNSKTSTHKFVYVSQRNDSFAFFIVITLVICALLIFIAESTGIIGRNK